MVQPVKKGVKQAYKRKTHTVNKSVPINTDRVGDRIDTKVKKKTGISAETPKETS